MKRYLGTLCAMLATVALSACGANFNSIDRTTSFGTGSKAIHLDAKQRAILTKKGIGDFPDMVCAESGPSALAAYSSSFGAGGTAPTPGAAQIAVAIAGASQEGAVSLDLRTQSTEVLKQTLYRICELYFNGGLSSQMVMQLHERFQDSTVAIVAIEQLTGVTAAQAGAIAGAAKSSSKADVRRERESNLERLEDLERQRESSVKESRLNEAKLAAKARTDRQTHADAVASGTATPERLTELDSTATASETAASEATQDRETAEKRLERTKRSLKTAETALDTAEVAAEAEAKTSTQLSQTSTGGLSPGSGDIEAVATAVKEIVQLVFKQDHVRDSCLVFLTKKARLIATDNMFPPEKARIEKLEMTREATKTWCRTYLETHPPN